MTKCQKYREMLKEIKRELIYSGLDDMKVRYYEKISQRAICFWLGRSNIKATILTAEYH